MITKITETLQDIFKNAIEQLGQGKEASDVMPDVNASVAESLAEVKTALDAAEAAGEGKVDATELEAAQEKISTLEATVETLGKEVSEKETALEGLNAQVSELTSSNADLTDQKEALGAENAKLKEANAKLSKETDDTPADIENDVDEEDLKGPKDTKNAKAWEIEQDKKIAARAQALKVKQ